MIPKAGPEGLNSALPRFRFRFRSMGLTLHGRGCIRGWHWQDVAASGCGWLWLAGWLAWLAVRLTLHGNGFICDKLWLGCLVDWLFRCQVHWLFVVVWLQL